ncbi:hypothetical protein [Flavobacterium aciduliphilum]|uniref:Uncharacterized protein n=1 Tax=Flavobacterium aciduliphilum TaxID=1101402 RepID=A0A328YED5_9FLAO|nr:hypothetical protein [Flavobacterium aciduliphilum]RAR71503.1 hypothetical protein CLV55_10759 [Flavobacterium aciduliphilum]
MKSKTIILALLLFVSVHSFSQKFYLGDRLTPKSTQFKLLGISSATGVHTYKYIGAITEKYFFNRRIGEIVVGIKNGIIVTTIYNLIPEKDDVGVPQSTLDLVQKTIPFPLAYVNGVYGANIDNMSISLSRTSNAITFHKDRIMFLTSVKNSILRQ